MIGHSHTCDGLTPVDLISAASDLAAVVRVL